MADICMCKGREGCEQCSKCFRKLAHPSEYQTIAEFNSCDNPECGYYWPVKNKKELDKLNKIWED